MRRWRSPKVGCDYTLLTYLLCSHSISCDVVAEVVREEEEELDLGDLDEPDQEAVDEGDVQEEVQKTNNVVADDDDVDFEDGEDW